MGAINTLPLSNIGDNTSVDVIDHPAKTMGDMPQAGYRIIAGDYFSALKIPVVKGRGFTLADSAGAPPVALINESAARQWYPGRTPWVASST